MSRSHRFFLGLLLSLSLVSIVHANVDYVPQPLEKAIAAADIVAQVRITSVNETPCGNDYSASVVKTYKGNTQSILTFAARRSPITHRDREVHAGDELLVLLSPRPAQQEPYNTSCCPDTTSPPAVKAELECRARLASYTPLKDFESSFLLEKRTDKPNSKPITWLWYESIRTRLPSVIERKDIRALGSDAAGTCAGPFCRVRWNALERHIAASSKASAK